MTGTTKAPVTGRSQASQKMPTADQTRAIQLLQYMVRQEMTRAEIRDFTGLAYVTVRNLLEGISLPREETCRQILAFTRVDIRIWQAERLAAARAIRAEKDKFSGPGAQQQAAARRKLAFKRLSHWRHQNHLSDAEIARLTGLNYDNLRLIIDNPTINITRPTVDKILAVTDKDVHGVLANRPAINARETISTPKLHTWVEELIETVKRTNLGYKGIHASTGLAPVTISRLLKGEPLHRFRRETLLRVLNLEEALSQIPHPAEAGNAPTAPEAVATYTAKLHSQVEERIEAVRRSSITNQQVRKRTGLAGATVALLLDGGDLHRFHRSTLLKFLTLTDEDMDIDTATLHSQVRDLIETIKRENIQYAYIRAHTGLGYTTISRLLSGKPLENFRPHYLRKFLTLTGAINQPQGGIEDE